MIHYHVSVLSFPNWVHSGGRGPRIGSRAGGVALEASAPMPTLWKWNFREDIATKGRGGEQRAYAGDNVVVSTYVQLYYKRFVS